MSGTHSALDEQQAFSNYYEAARNGLLELLAGEPAPRRVLEIGCGGGANLAELKRRFNNIHTIGVEKLPQAAAAARNAGRVDEMIVGDVLDAEAVSFETATFDLIVLSHVLEHLAQPEQVLERCKQWLRPEGRMLIALPNLRHFSVLKELLVNGDFRYRDDGILDRTHLRFYTRRSAERLFAAHGLAVVKRRGDIAGRRSRTLDLLSLGLAREFTAFAFNFLVVRT
ncbi:class I SAM-dependent methyltransferase [Piscinibacter sakaiensis]|uniref:class I SAM-dependent methyltransferase n=1 Tax=Piscinibacter sakaiensis TaxID=1547922 RepID=UPI003AAD1115